MRRAGDDFFNHPPNFSEFFHQVDFRVKSTRRVNDHNIRVVARPDLTASNATAAGSEPCFCWIILAPARSAQISSCSFAAARNVSAAPIKTFFPLRTNHGRVYQWWSFCRPR